MQPLDQDRRGVPPPHVSDDAAHRSALPRAGGGRAEHVVVAREAEPFQLRQLVHQTRRHVDRSEHDAAAGAHHARRHTDRWWAELRPSRLRLYLSAMPTPHRAAMLYQDWGRRFPPVRPRRGPVKRRSCVTPLLADHRDARPARRGFHSNRPRPKELPPPVSRTRYAQTALMPVPATPSHSPLVLIANAQEWVTRSLESILRPAGYAVLKAYTGHDALEGARRSGADVIVLDTGLPETDVL